MSMRSTLLTTCLLSAALAVALGMPQGASAQETAAETEPATVVEEVAIMETNHGTIVLRFFPDVAPNHVEAFKTKMKDGVYTGTKFHRVIPGFMIQGGDPNSKDNDRRNDGLGGVGPMLKAEFSTVPHRRGILSTARKNQPDTATSQFFIMVKANPGLDRKYTVFGQVVEGLETVDKIVSLRRDQRDNPLPDNPATIVSIKLEEREIPERASWTYPR